MAPEQIWVPSLLLLFFISCCRAVDCSASVTKLKTQMTDDNQCRLGNVFDDTGVRTTWQGGKGIEMVMVDSDKGIMRVTFPLAPAQQFNKYKLDLFVAMLSGSDLTEENCSKVNFYKYPLHHSVRILDIDKCDDLGLVGENCTSTCTGMGFVNFHYVFSACYNMKIIPYNGGNSDKSARSSNVVMHSNYSLRKIINMVPTITVLPKPKEHSFRVSYQHLSVLYTERLAVTFSIAKLALCPSSTQKTSSAWVMVLTESDTLKCGVMDGTSQVPDCDEFQIDHNTFTCEFRNMSSGNYCIMIEPQDSVRCVKSPSSVWMSKTIIECLFYHSFTLEHEEFSTTPSVEPLATNDSLYVVLGAVLALVVFVGVIFFSVRYSRGMFPGQHQPVPLPPRRSTPITQQQVLLLYAQDCMPFMKLMATFRTLLANVGQCEVFDCFDPARDEEVALSPCEWMRYRASSSAVKVVVVASECAAAHQRALSEGVRLQYCNPRRYNNLFTQGLQSLMYDDSRKEYLKSFVVRFDDRDISYLTPFTRFRLPPHLLELLRSLNPNIDEMCLQHSKDAQQLKDDHADFLLYKQQNLGYLATIMTRSAELV